MQIEFAGEWYLAYIDNVLYRVFDTERLQHRFACLGDGGRSWIVRGKNQEIVSRLELRNIFFSCHVLLEGRVVIQMLRNDVQQDRNVRTGLDLRQLMTRELMNKIRLA